ncbi:MAG TPA: hypothetical protein VGP64_18010 [Polyangia bacterium]|jgi:hypothetical protein
MLSFSQAPYVEPEDDAACPGPDCVLCIGEGCEKCGAGLTSRGVDAPPCEHDVIQRHEPRE